MEQFKIGDKVRVIPSEHQPWTADWPDTYIVVGARLEYQGCERINYSIASQDEIEHKLGSADGFYDDRLALA